MMLFIIAIRALLERMESCQSGRGRGGYMFDHQDEYPSQWKAIESISEKLSLNHEGCDAR